ncbi:MAG: hypothetical protein L3J91_02630, partial [Thermoplasmata archaeon]|nr:hypothetical protein [Thermoplasmata archaeon]
VLDRGVARPQCDATTLLDAPTDAFAARFVGFENVFDAEALGAGTEGSLRRWLLDRSGSAGIAFETPSFPAGASDRPLWEGRVRSVRPGPHGLTIEATADELLVTLRLPPPVTAPLPTLGATLAFGIDPGSVRALGVASRAAGRP